MVGLRYYNPYWKRYISPSITTVNPSVINGLNTYVFSGNNPINVLHSGTFAGLVNSSMAGSISFNENNVSPSEQSNSINSNAKLQSLQLTINSVIKDYLLALSEYSGTLIYSLTKNGREMLDFYRVFDGIDGFTTLDNLPHPANSVFKFLGIGLMIHDTVSAGINSYYSGHSLGQGALNVGLTAGKNYLIFQASSYVTTAVGGWVGAKLGASLGAMAGPLGIVVGVATGTAIGIIIDSFGDAFIDWVVAWFD